LAAVGFSYTLMTFLTSILLGLCMGSGVAISMLYGSGEKENETKYLHGILSDWSNRTCDQYS
jgi:Na+-driven multidrug efflux pump